MSDSSNAGAGSSSEASVDPLMGATPPETVPSPSAAANAISTTSPSWSSEPLYGAPVAALSSGGMRWNSPARTRHGRSTNIYRYLKTLSYVLALALGAGSVFAGIWSMFILPLLHSSFAARKAITEQQLNNMSSFVQRLKSLRSSSLYPAEVQAVNSTATEEKQGTITDIPEPTSLSLISPLSALPTALRVLTEAMQATDTTRTSLMTSLSSYTNELHTQSLGMKVGGHGYSGFGLNAALAKEGAAGGRGVEWDEARKEVRLIKGLLMNRRAFT